MLLFEIFYRNRFTYTETLKEEEEDSNEMNFAHNIVDLDNNKIIIPYYAVMCRHS